MRSLNIIVFLILLLFLTPTMLMSVDAQEFNNFDEGTLTSLEYTTQYIRGEPSQKIHCKVKADGPLNIYIRIPSSSYYKRNDYVESDYFNDGILLSKSGESSYDFIWEVPENRGYVLYVYNPNYGNVTYELKYTEPYYDYPEEMIFYLIIILVLIVVIVIIIFAYRSRKRKKNRKRKKYYQ